MRLVFLGSPPFATASFAALCAREERPVALVTAPSRRSGRGRKQAVNPLVELAEAAGVPVLRPESAKDPDFLREFAALEPDLAVVVSYGQLLVQEFLDAPRYGCVNVHGSLLPRWRGASPIQAALLAGDEETGVCLQRVVLALDAGAVLAERRLPIGPAATAAELAPRLAALGAELLADFLDQVGDGPLPEGTEQDESLVTVCRKLKREHAAIDWSLPAVQLERVVRAMSGWPVAYTAMPDGAELRVHAASLPAAGEQVQGSAGSAGGDATAAAAPGTVLDADQRLLVACGEGVLQLDRLQRAGKAPLEAAEFLRGRSLRMGERLG